MSREFTTAEIAVLDAARAYKIAEAARIAAFNKGSPEAPATKEDRRAAARADDEAHGAGETLKSAALRLP